MLEGSRLAALVASKVCHDMVSPMNAMIQGIEMLKEADTGGKNAEALNLLEQGVNRAWAKLEFFRMSFADGIGIEGEAALEEVKPAAMKLYTALKPELIWSAGRVVGPRPLVKAFLNLAFIAADCLPKGGAVTIEAMRDGEDVELQCIAKGPRTMLKAETAACLAGKTPEHGFAGANVVPLLTGLLARQAGAQLLAREVSPQEIVLVLRSPALQLTTGA